MRNSCSMASIATCEILALLTYFLLQQCPYLRVAWEKPCYNYFVAILIITMVCYRLHWCLVEIVFTANALIRSLFPAGMPHVWILAMQ